MMKYDEIHIEDLEIYARHGVFPEETKLGQRFIVSVILLAFITISCGTNKRVYAPPFEEEETESKRMCGPRHRIPQRKLKIQSLLSLEKKT